MTIKKPDTLGHSVPAQKWIDLRKNERITRTSLPHINSTMRGLYDGRELAYRGRVA